MCPQSHGGGVIPTRLSTGQQLPTPPPSRSRLATSCLLSPTTKKLEARRDLLWCVASSGRDPNTNCAADEPRPGHTSSRPRAFLTQLADSYLYLPHAGIAHLSDCKQLTELDVKRLCDKVCPPPARSGWDAGSAEDARERA